MAAGGRVGQLAGGHRGANLPWTAQGGDPELGKLAGIYVARGLTPGLAAEVAAQFMVHDALAAHARDELGMSEFTRARPIQAALTSAAAFAVGAALPLLLVVLVPLSILSLVVAGSSLLMLLVLGALAAGLGGAPRLKGATRVAFWGVVAMGCTAMVGRWFGTLA
jgi:VIT1/CCC1 family predicted Fe2+/Mn2+ transporter